MLKPNNAWKWYFDKECNALMLDLGNEMVFRVSIEAKLLIPDAFNESPFSVDDASLFQTFSNAVKSLELSGPRKAELILNAVAANRFHKPVLPKSWFFESQQKEMAPQCGEVIRLTSLSGESAPFLVIENAGSASLCMQAADSDMALSDSKTLPFCGAIKVMNDRLSQFLVQPDSSRGHFALVG